MTDAIPTSRRFAVDLSRTTCLEFLEFIHFPDGKTVVFCRQFLLTVDYTLPVVARAALYAGKSADCSDSDSNTALGKVLMKAAVRETANCPSCFSVSQHCKCTRLSLTNQSTRPLRLNTSTWTQYVASFLHKSRRGMTQLALFASVPQVGDVEIYNSYVHSLTVLQFGESSYMSNMQRKAVHGLNIDVLMPRLDSRIDVHALANDWERAHEKFVTRKKRYLNSDVPHNNHQLDQQQLPQQQLDRQHQQQDPTTHVLIQDTAGLPPLDLSENTKPIDSLIHPPMQHYHHQHHHHHHHLHHIPVLRTQIVQDTEKLHLPLPVGNTPSSNETEPSLDDVAAISAIVDSTINSTTHGGCARVAPSTTTSLAPPLPSPPPPLISPGLIDSIVTGTALNTSPTPLTSRGHTTSIGDLTSRGFVSTVAALTSRGPGPYAATTLTSPPVPRTTTTAAPIPISGWGISATSNLPASKRSKPNNHDVVDNFRPISRRTHNRKNTTDTTVTKPHCCTRCDARFKARGDLARHVLTVHEGKKVYTCGECGKTFGHSGHLNRHKESVHQKRRRHKCNQCGDSFFQASHLQSHVQHVHDRRKPWGCHLCALRLATENGLRNHLRNLHNAKADHVCPKNDCDEAFLLETDLNRHLRRAHLVPKSQLVRTRVNNPMPTSL